MASRRSYHHDDLRSAAVSAALDTISKEGIDALTLRGVAARAGVTHPALYHHFPDKPSLLAAVAEHCFGSVGEDLTRALRNAPSDPEERIRRLARAFARWAVRHREFFEVVAARTAHRDGTGGPRDAVPRGLEPGCTCAGCRNFGLLSQEVERAQAAGSFVAGPTRDLAFMIWSFVLGYMLAQLQGRGAYSGSSLSGLTSHLDACLGRLLDGLRS